MRNWKKGKWSVFQVISGRRAAVFSFGKHRLKALSSDCLREAVSILVYRDGNLIDRGHTKNMGGHDGSVKIAGLENIVPAWDRVYRAPPMNAGFVHQLLPGWFKAGDVIRIHTNASTLLSWLRILENIRKARRKQ